jgi:type IV pilus assembly protein PilA
MHSTDGLMTSSTRLMQQRLLINRLIAKQGRKGLAQGFTLIELMIVVAIIGVLSAVAIPQFLGVRDRAAAGAKVAELVGIAKECSVGQVTGTVQTLAIGTSGIKGATECSGTQVELTTTLDNPAPDKVKCLTDDKSAGATSATITVAADGSMTCAWGGGGGDAGAGDAGAD